MMSPRSQSIQGAKLRIPRIDAADESARYQVLNELNESNDTEAIMRMGRFYRRVPRVVWDELSSIPFLRAATSSASPDDLYDLATALYRCRLYDEARLIVERAVSAGSLMAKYLVAYNTEIGLGVEKNVDTAITAYTELADALPIAKMRLSECYTTGTGVPFSRSDAIRLIVDAAHANSPEAWREIGQIIERGEPFPQAHLFPSAIACFERAAQLGDVHGAIRCGEYYTLGTYDAIRFEKGLEYLFKGAMINDARANYALALLLATANHVERDDELLVHFAFQSALSGDSNAQVLVGRLYERGRVVRENHKHKRKWFLRAAENGNQWAADALAAG